MSTAAQGAIIITHIFISNITVIIADIWSRLVSPTFILYIFRLTALVRIGIPYLPCVGCGFPLCLACQPPATPASDASSPVSPAPPVPPSPAPTSPESPDPPPVPPSSTPAPPANQASPPFKALPEWHKAECHLLKVKMVDQ